MIELNYEFNLNSIFLKDDRKEIPDGSVSNLAKQFSMPGSSRESKNFVDKKDKNFEHDESSNIKLYGTCFVSKGELNSMEGKH